MYRAVKIVDGVALVMLNAVMTHKMVLMIMLSFVNLCVLIRMLNINEFVFCFSIKEARKMFC